MPDAVDVLSRALRKPLARGVEGQVLYENHPMLQMCRELGFEITEDAEAPDICNVRLVL